MAIATVKKTSAEAPLLELEDVQALLARGYKNLPFARYLLLSIDDAKAARSWIRGTACQIPNSNSPAPEYALHMAFTWQGILALGYSEHELEGFSHEFRQGMADEHRARMLGDREQSHPSEWHWGGPNNEQVHVLLMCYCIDEQLLEKQCERLQYEFSESGLRKLQNLPEARIPADSKEHFGFRDGIAQPVIEGLKRSSEATNTLKAGEFILGYENEYGEKPVSPNLRTSRFSSRDLGKNGSYLVFRQLSQDVRGFWEFLDAQTQNDKGVPDAQARLHLASKMVGRWPSGCPVTLSPDVDDLQQADRNDFLYREKDANGHGCPLGSHVRRTNPRDALQDNAEQSIAISNRHRLLRRGRNYGKPAEKEIERLLASKADGVNRGLHFICFNTDIRRQFEFVQQTWINNPKFGGLYSDSDPLLGRHAPDGTFTLQGSPARKRISGMRRFVNTVGGGYFFMPGIRALKHLVQQ